MPIPVPTLGPVLVLPRCTDEPTPLLLSLQPEEEEEEEEEEVLGVTEKASARDRRICDDRCAELVRDLPQQQATETNKIKLQTIMMTCVCV